MEKIRNGDPVDGDSSEIIAGLDKFLEMIKNGGAEAGIEPPPECMVRNISLILSSSKQSASFCSRTVS